LQILEQEQGDQRRPNLDLQGVRAGAHESLDAQILFQRLEEQLDLLALAVDGSDGGSSEAAMIGEKHQDALLLLVPHFDAAQKQVQIAAAGCLIEEDDLIAAHRATWRNRTALDHAVIGVSFRRVTKNTPSASSAANQS
jgi:hypothetical protein